MMGHLTYLVFELAWALPVLTLQWLVGGVSLWRARRTLAMAVIFSTLYLTAADGVAISLRIWTLHSDRITGLRLGGVPVEEAIFFLLTNALVVQSVILVRSFLAPHPSVSHGAQGG